MKRDMLRRHKYCVYNTVGHTGARAEESGVSPVVAELFVENVGTTIVRVIRQSSYLLSNRQFGFVMCFIYVCFFFKVINVFPT